MLLMGSDWLFSAYSAWMEARSSFVNGNYIATVMLCQGLAEQMLASHLTLSLMPKNYLIKLASGRR